MTRLIKIIVPFLFLVAIAILVSSCGNKTDKLTSPNGKYELTISTDNESIISPKPNKSCMISKYAVDSIL